MKSYKFLNTITGKHTIVTEQGKKNFESDASLSKQMKFIGECDVQGVLLKEEKLSAKDQKAKEAAEAKAAEEAAEAEKLVAELKERAIAVGLEETASLEEVEAAEEAAKKGKKK